jgi:histidine ammonia-lyase
MMTNARTARRPRAVIDGESLTLEQVEAIADGTRVALAARARKAIRRSRETVERSTRDGRQVYGVNTGFGHLASVRIDDGELADLQRNLVRSHAAGVGPTLEERVVRAVLALRVNCLARGHSGIRLATLENLVKMLNARIHPVVPVQGSVGASGDLAPLAHIALAMIGEGDVFARGRRRRAADALRRAGIVPARLEAKEGLALINGTQFMTAIGLLALLRAERLAVVSDIVGGMTLEALKGSHRAFDVRIHDARAHPGQAVCAGNLRRLLADGTIEPSHRDCGRVQDAYSLRCMPQVHGAARDVFGHVRRVVELEVNASTDNPMVFADDDELVSGGNFHGQPIAIALDHLAIGVATLGNISERRIERLVNPDLSGLPAFLAHDPGLHSGFMIAQVTAASLVSENKVLAHPASVDTVPTSAGKEDHVSMGAHAARKATSIVDNVSRVLAIEALCAAQALDMLRPLRAGRGIEAARRTLRRRIAHLDRDREIASDIERATELVEQSALRRAAERAVGPLD